MTTTNTLSGRDRAILRAVAAGGAELALGAETDLFLDRAKPSYIGGILEMNNARLYRFWGSLTEAFPNATVLAPAAS